MTDESSSSDQSAPGAGGRPGSPEGPAGDPTTAAGTAPELTTLLLSTRSVEDFLDELVRTSATLLSASCGITMRRDDQPMTVASSDALASAVDEIQYGKDTGPCLEALHTGVKVSVPDMLHEHRWDGYPAQAMAYGVYSSLSMPMSAVGRVVAALNLYSTETHAFDDAGSVDRATALAAQGGTLLELSMRQSQQTQLTTQMREALTGRSAIDQAIGIVMGQQRCNAATAFEILRTASQGRNRKLRDIALDIVTSVGGEPSKPRGFNDPR